MTYSNDAKQSILGVTEQTLKEYGAVSKQTVIEMAEGVRRNSGAQLVVTVSGIAGLAVVAKKNQWARYGLAFYVENTKRKLNRCLAAIATKYVNTLLALRLLT